MDTNQHIQPGMIQEATFEVGEENLALHIGSGSSGVLATPWMIAFMERVSHRLLTCCLPEGYSSVGIHVDVQHLAPTPFGDKVRVRAEVLSIEGNRVKLSVQAWDASEQIGNGTHERVIIEEERFLRMVQAKRKTLFS